MKKIFVTCWLALLLIGICCIFWYHEWQYTLPTPIPLHYRLVKTGDHIDMGSTLISQHGKPLFIHFFNPDCPCSRFNMPHFKSLIKKYGDQLTFAVVLINQNKQYDIAAIRARYDLNVPILSDQSIATRCGVYSTPQAVILDADHDLYFRGNYNRSRYCSDPGSDFARMAIDSLLDHISHPAFSRYALQAYGCQTPYCTR